MNRLLMASLALVTLAGCETPKSAQRQALEASPYRQIALIPLERGADQLPFAAQATQMVEQQLRQAGFDIRELEPLSPRIKDKLKAATLAAKKVQAPRVLIGTIEEASEKDAVSPATYQFVAVPPPDCCTRAVQRCQDRNVFDEQLQVFVDACQGSHKRVEATPYRHSLQARFALRLKMVDVEKHSVLWEAVEKADATRLGDAAETVTRRLTQQCTALALRQPASEESTKQIKP